MFKKSNRVFELMEKSPWMIVFLSLMGLVSGLTGFSIVYLINQITGLIIKSSQGVYDYRWSIAFGLTIALFAISRRILSKQVIAISQNLFWNIRRVMVELLVRCRYADAQALKNEVYAAIHYDAANLTAGSTVIIGLVSNVILTVASLTYMAFLSLPLFGCAIGTLVLGVLVYQRAHIRNNRHFARSRDLQSGFLKYFDALFYGLKEVNMEPRKGRDINSRRLGGIINEAHQSDIKGYVGYLNGTILGQLIFYILIGAIILHLGFWLKVEPGVIVNIAFLLLFVLVPIESILLAVPVLTKAAVSLKKMLTVIDELELNASAPEKTESLQPQPEFSSISVNNLRFGYAGLEGFSLGPVNLEIRAAEALFIYGGNGSGKSTFIKVLLQLYPQQEGTISWNGSVVRASRLAAYRRQFAVVFSDFYLFDELFGIDQADPEQLMEYMELFEVDKKVSFRDGKFSTVELSTGQRKRLAIIAALLENKPVLVLDEWAADQDPEFRRKFYCEIIPYIKSRGITILAITHDDAYYHCADRIFRMDYGLLSQVKHERPAEKKPRLVSL